MPSRQTEWPAKVAGRGSYGKCQIKCFAGLKPFPLCASSSVALRHPAWEVAMIRYDLLLGFILAAILSDVRADLLHDALAGPLNATPELIFCTRSHYNDGHWYANIGYYCDDTGKKAYAGNDQPDKGVLYRYNLRTHAKTVLLDAKGGSIRDPQVDYGGHTLLFSYRPAGTDYYHLSQ